ncbi:hypothetical protein BN1723_007427 [Verticillium longisporum]|uniref:Zn(2)-C6 fungal-type domain-containing protein n=2 Tax=Verticillium TaxID=1036719 RepID=G2XFM0_VERDV|nr:uncharacterized protein VDAG_09144 [Verticillium dahliae VdLs.17]EGY18618.1 hypothetical protein VDAG_09144 [Verticillium dahliae VdLs.17]KAH6705814.1 hypothetical protein EV126DRAFT_177542 [Verticillium dahliae]CRK12756.1 hypothetical protein BN1708_010601 [Verticillium longisporum]CRK47250.1 hypothetical protein BN1723_007427 [Verticillium longisporum]
MTSSDNQHFRKILPAEAGLESAGTTATTSSSASAHAEALPTSLPCPSNTLEESERSKRKRSRTQVSCNDCRRKKIRCDGQRPKCQACRKKLTPCVYPEPPDEITIESSEILHVLLSSSDIEALDILRMLRASHEPAAVLSILKATSDCRAKSSAPTLDLHIHSAPGLNQPSCEYPRHRLICRLKGMLPKGGVISSTPRR